MSEIVRIGVSLTRQTHEVLGRKAKEHGMSQSGLIEALILMLDNPENDLKSLAERQKMQSRVHLSSKVQQLLRTANLEKIQQVINDLGESADSADGELVDSPDDQLKGSPTT